MATVITTQRPKQVRCYVKVTDPETGKGKTQTVYGIDADTFSDQLPEFIAAKAATSVGKTGRKATAAS